MIARLKVVFRFILWATNAICIIVLASTANDQMFEL